MLWRLIISWFKGAINRFLLRLETILNEMYLRRGALHYLKEILLREFSRVISIETSKYESLHSIFILVDKILNGVTVHVEVKIYDERVEKGNYALQNTVSHIFFVTLCKEFLESIFAQSFVQGHLMKIVNQIGIFSIHCELLYSVHLLPVFPCFITCLTPVSRRGTIKTLSLRNKFIEPLSWILWNWELTLHRTASNLHCSLLIKL